MGQGAELHQDQGRVRGLQKPSPPLQVPLKHTHAHTQGTGQACSLSAVTLRHRDPPWTRAAPRNLPAHACSSSSVLGPLCLPPFRLLQCSVGPRHSTPPTRPRMLVSRLRVRGRSAASWRSKAPGAERAPADGSPKRGASAARADRGARSVTADKRHAWPVPYVCACVCFKRDPLFPRAPDPPPRPRAAAATAAALPGWGPWRGRRGRPSATRGPRAAP